MNCVLKKNTYVLFEHFAPANYLFVSEIYYNKVVLAVEFRVHSLAIQLSWLFTEGKPGLRFTSFFWQADKNE